LSFRSVAEESAVAFVVVLAVAVVLALASLVVIPEGDLLLLLFLPLLLFLSSHFSCHPSPQAEDLLLLG
jgi:hypothetical protein